MKSKILILRERKDDYFLNRINYNDIYNIYRDNVYKSILFKISRKLKLPFHSYYFCDWKKKLREYDTIIIFDKDYMKLMSKYIKKINPNIKIILWFWNKIKQSKMFVLEDRNIDEIWTFDEKDAKKYGFKLNTQFYTNNIKISKRKIEYDVLFLGRNKGRMSLIDELKDNFEIQNLKANLKIIENEKDIISYYDYLNLLENSRTILDLTSNNQCGLSLRCMESIFFEKKLITNNKNIKEYDFYDPENVFILGQDDLKKLKKFISSEYKRIDENIINNYDFKNWLNRFKNNN